MTPNHYIITEEQLVEMERTGLSQLASKFRSQPFHNQREKVLDELVAVIKSGNLLESREALEHYFGRHDTCKHERTGCPFCREELRQAGEP